MRRRDPGALHFLLRLVSALILTALASACTHVEPWQRGTLAKPHMALDPDPVTGVMRQHSFTSREAASGGTSAAGGGCGCS